MNLPILSREAQNLLDYLQERTVNQLRLIDHCDSIVMNEKNPETNRKTAAELSRYLAAQLNDWKKGIC